MRSCNNEGPSGYANLTNLDRSTSLIVCNYCASIYENMKDWQSFIQCAAQLNSRCVRCCLFLVDCKDNHYFCGTWARRGECRRNPGYMWKNCKKACNKCGGGGNFAYLFLFLFHLIYKIRLSGLILSFTRFAIFLTCAWVTPVNKTFVTGLDITRLSWDFLNLESSKHHLRGIT